MFVLYLDFFVVINFGFVKINNLVIFLCILFLMMVIFGVFYNNRVCVKGFWLVLLLSKILSLLKYLYLFVEFVDCDVCVLS